MALVIKDSKIVKELIGHRGQVMSFDLPKGRFFVDLKDFNVKSDGTVILNNKMLENIVSTEEIDFDTVAHNGNCNC